MGGLCLLVGVFIAMSDPWTARVGGIAGFAAGVAVLAKLPQVGWGKGFLLLWFGLSTAVFGLLTRSLHEEGRYLTKLQKQDVEAYDDYAETNFDNERVREALQQVDQAKYNVLLKHKQAVETEQLRSKDSETLEELLQNTPELWLARLEELRPEEYADVMAGREQRLHELDNEVRGVPAGELQKNKDLYSQLVALDPENSRYVQKYRDYSRKLDVEKWKAAACSTGYPEDEAGQYAKDFVKQSLKAPSTAKFPLVVHGEYIGNCQFVVNSWVDAQNGFGAQIRTNYTVTMIRSKSSWQLVSLETR